MKFFIVDDSNANRAYLERLIIEHGHDAISVASGEEALKKLRRARVDLIISDVLMPDMDGFAFLQQCKAVRRLKKVPFVFLSDAFLNKKDEELALKLGASAFIYRPVEPERLMQILVEVASSKPVPARKGRKPKAEKAQTLTRSFNPHLIQKLENYMCVLEGKIQQHLQAAESQRHKEEQYHLLFETMPVGVVCQDAAGRIVGANPAAGRILGLTQDQMLGNASYNPRWRAIRLDSNGFSRDELPAMISLKTGKPVADAVIGVFNPRDVRYHWVRINSVPLFKPGEDKPYQVYSTLVDITEDVLTNRALEHINTSITSTLENISDIVFLIDGDCCVVYANAAAKGQYKLIVGSEMHEGMNILDPMAAERKQFWSQVIQRGLSGEHATLEQHYRTPAGEVDLTFSADPIVSETGAVAGLSFFGRNITANLRAVETLRKQEKLFRMLFLCNGAVVRASGEVDMLQNVCRAMVEVGEYRLVRAGYIQQDAAEHVRYVACAGEDGGYTAAGATHVGEGNDPVLETIRTGKIYVCQDVSHDPVMAVWREEAVSRGYGSYVALPLISDGAVIGMLEIYIAAPNSLDADEVSLLEGLAGNLAYGITSLREREQRMRVEDSLRQSEERYRTILAWMHDVYYEMDAEGNLTSVNEAACRQMGYLREELVGLNYKACTPADEMHRVAEIYSRVLQTGEPVYEVPLFGLRKDGTKRYFEGSILPLRGESGEIAGLRVIGCDVTELKLTQKELATKTSLLEIAIDAMVTHTIDGVFSYLNENICAMLGYTREELLRINVKDLFVPEDAEVLRSRSIEAQEKGETNFNAALLHKDGSVIPVEIHARIAEIGGTRYYLSVVKDITQQLKSQQILEESEKRYRRLVDNAPDIIFRYRLKPKYEFEYINPSVEKILGYAPEDLIEHPELFKEIIYPEDYHIFEEKVGGNTPCDHSLALRWRHKDGGIIWLELICVPVYDHNGELVAIEGITRNITDRKKYEDELQEALDDISATLEGTIDALARMSELRDPYTAGHQRKVTQLALAIADELGLSSEHKQALRVAGLLHDIGKVYVPSEILSKSGELSPLELNLVKAHVQAGYEIIKSIRFPWPICSIVQQHHERLDGSGYPQGLSGEQITLEARILAVADVVEAMMSHRPYRAALGIDQALEEIIRNKGMLYDEKVVDACVTLFTQKGFKFAA